MLAGAAMTRHEMGMSGAACRERDGVILTVTAGTIEAIASIAVQTTAPLSPKDTNGAADVDAAMGGPTQLAADGRLKPNFLL